MKIFCESERLYFRYVELADLHLIVKWKNDPLIKKMSLGMDTQITFQNQERDILRSIEENKDLYLIIILKVSDKPIGYIRINWMDETGCFAWLRYGLGEEREKGYAKEALKAVLKKLFALNLHRVDAEVFEFNEPSLKLLKALGFKEEGIRRDAYYNKDRYFDVIVLGLLEKDITREEG